MLHVQPHRGTKQRCRPALSCPLHQKKENTANFILNLAALLLPTRLQAASACDSSRSVAASCASCGGVRLEGSGLEALEPEGVMGWEPRTGRPPGGVAPAKGAVWGVRVRVR